MNDAHLVHRLQDSLLVGQGLPLRKDEGMIRGQAGSIELGVGQMHDLVRPRHACNAHSSVLYLRARRVVVVVVWLEGEAAMDLRLLVKRIRVVGLGGDGQKGKVEKAPPPPHESNT